MVIELVSPHTRDTDVKSKREEYHRIQIPLFVMVDQKREDGPRELRVFRHSPEAFVEEGPERVLIPQLGLYIGLKENRVVCYDAGTGEELGDYAQELHARRAAERQAHEQTQARETAEQRIQELEAELRRLRGNDRP